MQSEDAHIATPLAFFTSVCEAAEIPSDSRRLDVFLRLPEWQQEAIIVEINAEAAQMVSGDEP
jgi:hypothetical protein